MFFNIDGDDGHVINGWVAPDNPSAVPSVVVIIPGRSELVVKADTVRSDVRDLGVHGTGQVGFRIDQHLVPDLDIVDSIELLEAETRLPIYCRFQPARHVERKMFLFDCSVMPQRRIISSLTSHFALAYPSSERLPLETMIVLINNHASKSMMFSGRSNYNRYVTFLESQEYFRAALLRDPFEELAERLLFLNLLAKPDWAHLVPLYATGLTSLIEFARDLPLNEPKGLLTAFRNLTDEQRMAIRSPMVRMIGCSLDDVPTYNHVSLALDHLAALDVVGTRAQFPGFRAMMNQMLGADVLGAEEPASFQSVPAVAQSLAKIGIVADLLEYDVALYSLANEAVISGSGSLVDDAHAI